jgi:hypothetical protein
MKRKGQIEFLIKSYRQALICQSNLGAQPARPLSDPALARRLAMTRLRA